VSSVDLLVKGWDWEPSAVIGCIALVFAYFAAMWKKPSLRMLYFLGGVLLLLLDLVSPLDLLGDQYLFSAHIAQHFVLALIVPPLLLAGIPPWLAEAALERPAIAWLEREIGRPPVSWMLGVGTMIFWHAPLLFNAALANNELHVLQHLSFLITGTIFWWPVLTPAENRRLSPLVAISYLFSACFACSLLGAALTFARPGIYPAYLNPQDSLRILPLVRNKWGLDPANDQQLGGLLMWVPGCLVYLTGILATVVRWYGYGSAGEVASPDTV
jgi:putative membrane protein